MGDQLNQQILDKLPDWTIVDGKLNRVFNLGNFTQAFDFMSQVAIVAEQMNHHPEWSNVYKTVVIDLITHSKGCITSLDSELAMQIDDIFENNITKR